MAPKYRGELKAQFKKVGKNLANFYIKFGVDYFFKQDKIFSASLYENVDLLETVFEFSVNQSSFAINIDLKYEN